MTTQEVKLLLGSVGDNLSDDQIDELVSLYRAIARLFIKKHQEDKLEKSQ